MARRQRPEKRDVRGALDRRYLDALVRGDASAADAVVEQARGRGLTIEHIYLHLFTPAQAEIGVRWRARRLTVADEHLATEITLAQMQRLRDGLAVRPASGRGAVLACVEGEAHTVGLRMVADFLLIDGWAVDYVGANTPTADLVKFVARRRPELVALSITQAECLPALGEAAAALRRVTPVPRLLAGGAALRNHAGAAARFGVDAVALDARAAVREARQLTAAATPASPESAEDYFERLGRRLQELRSARGWKQQQLSEEAGLDRTYISGLEHGKQNPTIGALLRLARALEVPLDRLVLLDAGDELAAERPSPPRPARR